MWLLVLIALAAPGGGGAPSIPLHLRTEAAALNATLPRQVTATTTLVSVYVSGLAWTYNYRVSRAVSAEALRATFARDALPVVCANEDMTSLMAMGVVYNFSYVIHGRAEPVVIEVRQASCPA